MDGGSPAPRDGRVSSKNDPPAVCFLFHKNQPTAPRVPGVYCCTYCCTAVLMYVLLHCCSAVYSKGLVGGWVEGALRRPWWVGGPFCTWESFFCCFLFHKNQPTAPRVPGVYCCTYCCTAVLMYVLLHCCSAVLYLLLHCCSDVGTAALLFCCM